MKAVYKLRISIKENLFFLYKLSNTRTNTPVQVVRTGKTFDRRSNYTRIFLSVCEKYNIDHQNSLSEYQTTYLLDSFSKFCSAIYVAESIRKHEGRTPTIPEKALRYCEIIWEDINGNK